ncbi:MAG: PD40 domain-containing protein [Planctomycetes bacterium]|nr:PD40 domain-containing protein [Planctomycetota bacterium]
MRRIIAAAIFLCLACAPAAADETRVRELISLLDAEDAAVRDKALADPVAIGADALPLLEKACREGSPEQQGRAAEAMQRIRVRAALERLKADHLLKHWDELDAGPARRRRAIRDWVRACGSRPETVDALLELIRVDPRGSAGGAACEAMNWLGAPRLTARVADRASGHAWLEPQTGMDLLQMLFPEGPEISRRIRESLRATPQAKERLDDTVFPPHNDASPERELDQLGRICTGSGVTWRMDDGEGAVHVELPEESLAVWGPWWKAVRNDPVILMDLGLVDRPDGSKLALDAAGEWIARLSDADARRARVARAVLREAGADILEDIARRAAGKDAGEGLEKFAALIRLRTRGRILFVAETAERREQWIMRLDGSGARRISGDLNMFWSVSAAADGKTGFVSSRSATGEWGVYRFDLSGAAPPEKLDTLHAFVWPRPDGLQVALRVYEGGQLRLFDVLTRKATVIEEGNASFVGWSPDGTRLIWNQSQGNDLKVYELASGKTAVWPGRLPYLSSSRWNPDSRRIATDLRGEEAGRSRTKRVEVLDVTTGEGKTVIGPVETTSMGWPEWSPDGRWLAAAWPAADKSGIEVALWDSKEGRTRTVKKTVALAGNHYGNAMVKWRPDGMALIVTHLAAGRGYELDIAASTWRDASDRDFTAVWIPGTDWILDEDESDVWLMDAYGGPRLNLTESAVAESDPHFLPE